MCPKMLFERVANHKYPLHLAIKFLQSETVILEMLEMCPSVLAECDDCFQYPLVLALQYKQSETVILKMIEKFPEVLDKCDEFNCYPLQMAILNNHSEQVVVTMIEMAPLGQALLMDGKSYLNILCLAMEYEQSDNVILKILELVPETFVEEFLDTENIQNEFVQCYRPSDNVLWKLNQLFVAHNNNN